MHNIYDDLLFVTLICYVYADLDRTDQSITCSFELTEACGFNSHYGDDFFLWDVIDTEAVQHCKLVCCTCPFYVML